MNKVRSIKFVIALEAEALPIIGLYNLKKIKINKSPFKIYSNNKEKIYLIVSGIGSKNAKKSVAALNEYKKNRNCLWINIGLAGHANYKEGSLFEIKKVVNNISKGTLFTNGFMNNIKTHALRTVNGEEKIYLKKELYDMEGYGYLEALETVTDKDNIFIFKIVSDNLIFKPNCYKNFAIDNISHHIDKIKLILQKYRYNNVNNNEDILYIFNLIKNKYHLTFYNENKIIKLVTKILVLQNIEYTKNEVVNSSSLEGLIKKYEFSLKNYLLKI